MKKLLASYPFCLTLAVLGGLCFLQSTRFVDPEHNHIGLPPETLLHNEAYGLLWTLLFIVLMVPLVNKIIDDTCYGNPQD